MLKYFTLFFIFFISFSLAAQKSCEVVMESLQGEYNGKCKKGLASGEGIAIGKEDRYEGNFRKGFPHGNGKYTWGNGDVYEGNWVFGRRDGYGKFYSTTDDLIGVWEDDEFLYEQLYEIPYEITEQRNIRSVRFQKTEENPQQVVFNLKRSDGALPTTENLSLVNSSGTENINSKQIRVSNVTFPYKGDLIFTAYNSFRTNSYQVRLRFVIYEPGNWVISFVH